MLSLSLRGAQATKQSIKWIASPSVRNDDVKKGLPVLEVLFFLTIIKICLLQVQFQYSQQGFLKWE